MTNPKDVLADLARKEKENTHPPKNRVSDI